MGKAFTPNPAGIHALAVGPEMTSLVLAVAEKGKLEAEAFAAEFIKSGDYEKSFVVRSKIAGTVKPGSAKRATAILENTSGHAAAVEWGNAHNHKTHRVLGRVLDGLQRHE
jgi:hypothetical protein